MIGLLLVSLPAALLFFALCAFFTWGLFLNLIAGRKGALGIEAPWPVRLYAFLGAGLVTFLAGDAVVAAIAAIWARLAGR